MLSVGAVLFHLGNQRYARRCPQCTSRVEEIYRLGKRCPVCHTLFHPQLCLATSRDSANFLDRKDERVD